MKKTLIYILLCGLSLPFFAACQKSGGGQQPQPEAKMKGMFYTSVATEDEVIEITPGKTKTVGVRALADTENGSVSDITLTISFKGDLDVVDAYNVAHGTTYEACPGSAFEFVTNDVMMPRYGVSSSTAKLKLSASGMEEGKTYILPIIIDKVAETDNWEFAANPYSYVILKQAHVAPSAGSGTKEDPYNLYTVADLKAMGEKLEEGKMIYFRMQADIDMKDESWMPLNFSSPYKLGIDFDGNGHTIDNFSCDFANYPSFFGVLNGNCHDVTFTNAVIESAVGGATGILGSYCGTTGIPGEAHRVHVQGRVTSPGGNKNGTGGLFGRICEANITACSVDVEIESGEDYVGGIFGYDTGASTVSDCWSTGKVKAGSKVGGIGGGLIKANSAIYNCYSLMEVEGSFQVAGILGHANLDQKAANDSNEPNNHIEGCIAWNKSVAATPTDGDEHYSSGIIVGFTALKNFLANCFHKADFDFAEAPKNAELGYHAYDQQNSSPSSPLVHGSNTYDFAYHGKTAAATATVTSLAKSLGWSQSVWDFSADIPVLKQKSSGDPDVNSDGQLPDFDENEFYN